MLEKNLTISFLQEFQFEIGIKTIQVKHSYITKSVYVFYPTGSWIFPLKFL